MANILPDFYSEDDKGKFLGEMAELMGGSHSEDYLTLCRDVTRAPILATPVTGIAKSLGKTIGEAASGLGSDSIKRMGAFRDGITDITHDAVSSVKSDPRFAKIAGVANRRPHSRITSTEAPSGVEFLDKFDRMLIAPCLTKIPRQVGNDFEKNEITKCAKLGVLVAIRVPCSCQPEPIVRKLIDRMTAIDNQITHRMLNSFAEGRFNVNDAISQIIDNL